LTSHKLAEVEGGNIPQLRLEGVEMPMTLFPKQNRTSTLTVTLVFAACHAQQALAAELIAPLKSLHGDHYLLPACGHTGSTELRTAVVMLARDNAPMKAWKLVQHTLCGSRTNSRKYVMAHMPKMLRKDSFETGELAESVHLVERSESYMQEGMAWQARGEVEGEKLTITYSPNEACIASFTMIPWKNDWLIVRVGEACD
jgi:uncharacterized protein YeaC (DUF1315 family)